MKALKRNLVVVGGGGAGLSAAVAAAEAGVTNIMILEAGSSPGGNSLFPHGIFGAETKLQKRLGIIATKDCIFKKSMEYAHHKLNAGLVRTLIGKSDATIDWLEQKGLKFERIIPHYGNYDTNTYHVASGRKKTGAIVVDTLLEACRKLGVDVSLRTRAGKLMLDSHGKIAGVSASRDGRDHEIRTRGVILATGGYLGNRELIEKYDPLYNENEVLRKGIEHKGDGLLMALEAGAVTDGQLTHEMSGPSFRNSPFLTLVAKHPSTAWLNINGERFVNEDIRSPMEAGNAIYRQARKVSCSLLDSDTLRGIVTSEILPTERMMIGENPFEEGVLNAIPIQEKEGAIKVSGSLDDIADWMGADPKILNTTVAAYNRFCDRGYDEDFLKERIYLKPVRKPPFYLIPGNVSILVTHGGVRVNRRTEVLNREEKAIRGLYAAGGDMAGTAANTYNILISGNSFGFAINSGRIAGEEAAKYLAGQAA